MHNLTSRYVKSNGPLWTAEVQQAWGNVLDPLWEANSGTIMQIGEMFGLTSNEILRLPMQIRTISAHLTDETIDSSDGISANPNGIRLVYGAPISLLDRMRERDPYLNSNAGRRLLNTMAGFKDRQKLDDTYYDLAPRTLKSQMANNPYALDGFRTYSFFQLVRYAILRYLSGAHEARMWYMNKLCTDGGADWDYTKRQAVKALRMAGYQLPPCVGQGLHAHVKGYTPLPTFADRVSRDPKLPAQLWGGSAHRFGAYVFMILMLIMISAAEPVFWITHSIANRFQRQ